MMIVRHAFFKGQMLGEVVGTKDGKPCVQIVGRDLVVPILDRDQVKIISTLTPGRATDD